MEYESPVNEAGVTSGSERVYERKLNNWLNSESRIQPGMSLLDKLKILRPEKYERSDKGNAQLYADVFRNCIRFNATAREWFYYDESRWVEDTGGMIAAQKGKQLRDSLLIYAAEIQDEEAKENYIKYIAKLGSRRTRCTMIDDSRDLMYFKNEDLDQDQYLLNVQNGTLDLQSFEFMGHNPEHLISKMCNVVYDPEASPEAWEKFIDEVLEGDEDKIHYLQKLLGLSLTGDTREQCAWLLFGPTTRNGKSTLVETYAYMLGGSEGYALNMRPETLAQKQNNDSRQASGDIARLSGCRFLNASEPPKRMKFDTALLKNLLGRDTITARHLHQSEFQFIPVFKMVINTNFLPLVSDDTLFNSGRLQVITFNRHFNEDEQDKGLKDRLQERENLSGLLNWCIDGLKMYYNEGLTPPGCVAVATDEYRTASDKIGNFINECLIESPGESCTIASAYERFTRWCKDNGFGIENKGNFIAEMKGKGLYMPHGTVQGSTRHNIVPGYVIDDFMELPDDLKSPFND